MDEDLRRVQAQVGRIRDGADIVSGSVERQAAEAGDRGGVVGGQHRDGAAAGVGGGQAADLDSAVPLHVPGPAVAELRAQLHPRRGPGVAALQSGDGVELEILAEVAKLPYTVGHVRVADQGVGDQRPGNPAGTGQAGRLHRECTGTRRPGGEVVADVTVGCRALLGG